MPDERVRALIDGEWRSSPSSPQRRQFGLVEITFRMTGDGYGQYSFIGWANLSLSVNGGSPNEFSMVRSKL